MECREKISLFAYISRNQGILRIFNTFRVWPYSCSHGLWNCSALSVRPSSERQLKQVRIYPSNWYYNFCKRLLPKTPIEWYFMNKKRLNRQDDAKYTAKLFHDVMWEDKHYIITLLLSNQIDWPCYRYICMIFGKNKNKFSSSVKIEFIWYTDRYNLILSLITIMSFRSAVI